MNFRQARTTHGERLASYSNFPTSVPMSLPMFQFMPGTLIMDTAIALRIAEDPHWEHRVSRWQMKCFERMPFELDGVTYRGAETDVINENGQRVAIWYTMGWTDYDKGTMSLAAEVHL